MKKTLRFLALLTLTGFVAVSFHTFTKNRSQIEAGPKPLLAFSTEGLNSGGIEGPAVINFFASWCIPCEAEHPVITELAKDITVYGVAFMDKPEKVHAFLKRLGNPYKAIGLDGDGTAGASLNIIGVPTSFVIDGEKNIIYRHDAPLTAADAQKIQEILRFL